MSRITSLTKGQDAYRNQQWAEAYALFSAAEQESALEPEVLFKMGVAAYLTGKDSESTHIWSQAHAEFLNTEQNNRAVYCAFWLGMTLTSRGEEVRGSGWFSRARRILEDIQQECPEHGFLYLPEGLQNLGEDNGERAYALFKQALRIGKQFGNAELMILGRLGCGQALISQGKISEGTALLDEVMVSVEAEEVLPIAVGIVYCAVITTCHLTYDYQRAREWTSVLSHWCESQPEMVPFRGECLVRRAEVLQWRGEWSLAMDEIGHACDILSDPFRQSAAGLAYYRKGELHRIRGEVSAAESAYQQARNLGEKPQPGLALLWLAQEKIEAAKKAIQLSIDARQDNTGRAKLLPAYIEIMLAAGAIEQAQSAAGNLLDISETIEAPYLRAIAAGEKGAVLVARKSSEEALSWLEKSSQILKSLDMPYETARIRILTGLAHRQLGDNATAELEFESAKWILKRIGAPFKLPNIAPPGRSPSSGEARGLSQRELQILQLVATGKTNKTIASQLYISERTVDRHVSNILLKLDVASRTEATTFAYKHNLL